MDDIAAELIPTSKNHKLAKGSHKPVHDLRDWLARVERHGRTCPRAKARGPR